MIADEDLKKIICSNLTKEALKLFRPEPPFTDEMAASKEINGYHYLKYIQYYNELDESLKGDLQKIIPKLIDWNFRRQILNIKEGFIDVFPKEYVVLDQFDRWIRKKEEKKLNAPFVMPEIEKVDFKNIIKKSVGENIAGFRLCRKSPVPGIAFEQEISEGRNLLLAFEGSGSAMETSFSLLFGLSAPAFLIDVASFYGGSSCSYFIYYSEIEFKKQVDLAIKAIHKFLPIFEKCIKDINMPGAV